MKLLTTLVTTLLALSLWAGPNNHAATNKERDAKPDHHQPDTQAKEKPDRAGDHDQDRDPGRKDDHHDPRNCDDERHEHDKPRPPKPPKPPKNPIGSPAAPTGVTAEAVSLFQVTVTWTDHATNELGLKIERSLDGTNFTQIAQVLPDTTGYRDLNRFPDTKYFYRVRAFNAQGDSTYSNVARTQTPAPTCALSLVNSGITDGYPATGMTNLVAISRTQVGGLALRHDGSVAGWGYDWDGQYMNSLPALSNVVAICAGDRHRLALHRDGSVVSWGRNESGQCDVPRDLLGVTAISAGFQHSMALRNDGMVVCWGSDQEGQATPPDNLRGVVAIAAGYNFSLALRSDGTVVQWGRGYESGAPPPDDLTNVEMIAAGFNRALVLKRDGRVVGWGEPLASDPPPPGLTNIVAIATGYGLNFALQRDDTAQSWGHSPFIFATPVTFSNVVAIAAGLYDGSVLTTAPANPKPVFAKVPATNEVILTWENESPAVTEFHIERSAELALQFPGFESPKWTQVGVANGSVNHFSDRTVKNGETYWYRVRALNSCGFSQPSVMVNASVTAPEFGPNLSASAYANTVLLDWSSRVAGATGHRLERALDDNGAPGAWIEIAVTTDGDQTFQNYEDRNLLLDTTYWYRVRTFNGLGISPYSTPVSAKISLPREPVELRAWIGNTNQIELSWQANSPYDQKGFKVERASDVAGVPGTWVQITNLLSAQYDNRLTDTGILAYRTNWYRVRAYNDLGDSPYCQPLSVIASPPIAPLLSGNPFSTNAYLVWYDTYKGNVKVYSLEHAADSNGQPGGWAPLASVANKSTTPFSDNYSFYWHTNLSPNSTHWYRVRASNWLGASGYSAPVSVTIVPPQPPQLSVALGTAHRVNVYLYPTAPADEDGYKLERATDTGNGPGPWREIAALVRANSYQTLFADTNIAAGDKYWYRSRSFNAAGISIYSESVSVEVSPPSGNMLLWASAYRDTAVLRWYSGGFDYGRIEGYKVERAMDVGGQPSAWTQIGNVTNSAGFPGNGITYTDPGLSVNTTNWYRVRAYNWVGTGPVTDPVAVGIVPPAPPTSLYARVGDTNQIWINWYAASPADQDGFQLEHATDAGGVPGTWEQLATINSPTNYSAQFIHTNIAPNTTHWYRVKAFNPLGISDYSAAESVTVSAPTTAPYNLTASPFADQVNLYWNYNDATVTASSGYEIQRANDAGNIPGAWTSIGAAQIYYPTFTDSGRTANMRYWYRVRAVNWIGVSPFSTPVSVTVMPPRPPVDIGAKIGNTNTVNLQIASSPPNDQDGFLLERAADASGNPGTWEQIAVIGATNLSGISFADTNVTANTTIWYRVRSFNVVGGSAYTSALKVAVVPPPRPSYLGAQAFANTIQSYWNAYYEPYGYVRGFKLERATDVEGEPGTWEQIASSNGTSINSFIDTNRLAHIKYWYRVRAYNWVGDGEYSQLASATIEPPARPDIYNLTIGNTNRINFQIWFSHPYDQDGYKVERAVDASGLPGSWTEISNVAASSVNYSEFSDRNVSANTTNWYRIRSFNIIGDSEYSAPESIKAVPPGEPLNLTATPFANKVLLSWAMGHYYSYGFVGGIQVERAADAAGSPGTWARIATLDSAPAEYADTGLTPGATYWYRLRALNWIGASPYTLPASATITPPGAPVLVVGKIGGTNEVKLQVHAAATADQDGFRIERAPDTGGSPGAWSMILLAGATNVGRFDWIDTNAVAHTTNWYRASAFNVVGSSSNGAPIQVAILSPAPPYFLSATPFASQIWLSLNGYYDDYGEIEGIALERAVDSGGRPAAWSPIATITNFSYSWWPPFRFADTGLVANVTYWYRARAYNWIGAGEPSSLISATIVPPAPPRYLAATIGTTNHVELRWSPSEHNDEKGYLIERAPDVAGSPGLWVALPGSPSLKYTDTNVVAHALYWYRVRGYNEIGLSESTAPLGVNILPPPAPAYLNAAVFAGRVSLSWPTYSGYGLINGYQIERATGSGSPGTWVPIATVGVGYFGSYVDPDLTVNTKYWYRVRAYNWVGDGDASPVATATVLPPSAPVFVRADIVTTNQVDLTWQVGQPYDQDGIIVERAPDTEGFPGVWEELGIANTSSISHLYFTDTNVTANTTNWYRARTFNTIGTSTNSLPASVPIVPPPAPLYFTASAFANRAILQWFKNSYGYGEIGGYIVERAGDAGGVPTAWTQITNLPPGYYNNNNYTDPDLLAGSTYWYRVRAYSWVGVGSNTPALSVTIRQPAAPIFVTPRIGQSNRVDVRWSAGYPYDANVFLIERAADAAGVPGGWSQIGAQTNDYYYSSLFSDTNVTAFTTNWYRMRAWNGAGYSDYSAPVISRIMPPPAIPPQLIQTYRRANQVTFGIENNIEPYGQIAGFKIERAADSNGTPVTWSQLAAVPTPFYSGSFTDSNLVAQATYWYRLRGWSWVGDGEYTSPFSITILPPVPPGFIYAMVNNQNQIYLWWYMGYPEDQDGFKLERSSDAQTTWAEIATLSATNWAYGNYTDTNFAANVTNYYRVRAFNVIGDSPYSATVSAMISMPSALVVSAALVPAALQIESLTTTNQDVLLTWTGTGGTTNVVEATSRLREDFAPISANVRLEGVGHVTTNFLDVGALTNSASRFYRIRVVP
jgi:hypothetical protein